LSGIAVSVGGLDGPATLVQRLRVMQTKRAAFRRWQATKLAIWILSGSAILTVVGGGLLNVH
jgi:hypothetical protein